MSPTIEVTDEVYARLEKHVVGFDNPSNVIKRILDSFEKQLPFDRTKSTPSYKATSDTHRIFSNKEIQKQISSVAEFLPEDELKTLCDEHTSKEIFGISFPLFIKVNSNANQTTKKQAVKSNDGVNRWTWKFEFIRNGFAYAICTQWYPKNDQLVQQWLSSHESKLVNNVINTDN